ncbi:MAG: phosphoribosyltransferase, partial [Candidatus Heimdallarchaeota archaeon]|nr:phosphoribosyltransferase [Candidatus Heimdallarchaeota archaeon]
IIMPEISILSHHLIFREPKKYTRALDSNQTLGKYHPWREGMNPNFDQFSQQIHDVKNQKPDTIEYFTDRLHDILNDNEEYVICVIPSSKKGLADSGIRSVAKRLCQPPIIDGTDIIIRNRTVEPNHTSKQKRSLELELDSITIAKKEIIKGKQVLLLDDVATRGHSLNAGRLKLKVAGAILVAAIALGHTQF